MTKIEWCDYTINPVKGLCPMACSYCYARRMYKRFKWNEKVRFLSDAMDGCLDMKAGSKVFVGSTMELFGEWVKPEWLKSILGAIPICPDVTFIFLTKRPENLIKWSPFPDNCWVGVSVTTQKQFNQAMIYLPYIQARVKYLSLEPLLSRILTTPGQLQRYVNWVIIGQQTPVKTSTRPKPEWIQEIIDATNQASIPVFIKNNILDDWDSHWLSRWNRQEFPK